MDHTKLYLRYDGWQPQILQITKWTHLQVLKLLLADSTCFLRILGVNHAKSPLLALKSPSVLYKICILYNNVYKIGGGEKVGDSATLQVSLRVFIV